jgi:hypothetical protein
VPHESTGVHGRGTEEVKTNDVSGRVKLGEVGFTIEFGRPGVGVRFRDIEKMSTALARAGVAFEKRNPVTSLMSDESKGEIRADILDEKVLSAILEIKVPVSRTEEIIRLVWEVEKQIDSPVALGVGARCDENGEENVVAPILEKLGYKLDRWGRAHDEHTPSIRAGGKLSRRLRGFRDFQPRKKRSGRAAQAAAVSRNGAAVQSGEPGRRGPRRRAPSLQEYEADFALEARGQARFSGGDRRP